MSSLTVFFYLPFDTSESDRTEILMIPPESSGYYTLQKQCLHCVSMLRQRDRKLFAQVRKFNFYHFRPLKFSYITQRLCIHSNKMEIIYVSTFDLEQLIYVVQNLLHQDERLVPLRNAAEDQSLLRRGRCVKRPQ